jgi:hypothetical protein
VFASISFQIVLRDLQKSEIRFEISVEKRVLLRSCSPENIASKSLGFRENIKKGFSRQLYLNLATTLQPQTVGQILGTF